MSNLLTLQEAANLENKSYDSLRMKISRGKLKATKVETDSKKGFEYRVDINDLSDTAKAKYFASKKNINEQIVIPGTEEIQYNLEELTAQQRDEAYMWESIIKEYNRFISGCFKSKTEKTKEFITIYNSRNTKKISVRTLYDKQKLYRKYGVAALADGRKSKDKRGHKIDERLWSIFAQWWLDENKPTTSYVYDILRKYVSTHPELSNITLPSEPTFRRACEDDIPKAVVKYFREGNKAFEDECLPYITRTYEHISSNEFWSSDYHTLDLMVKDDITGEVYRPHLVCWIDIRSRKILSMRVRKESDSDGVILSFRDAVVKYGLPEQVYLDNGREFLTYAFGGRGKRKDGSARDYGTNILDRIGVGMVNAIVKNAKAKVIERIFKEVTSEFAKLFITYCGNRPGNRPERHNKVLKNTDNIPLASTIKEDLETFIEGWYNVKESKAKGLNGISPNECYAKNLITKRKITEEQANILLTRNERKQSVDRNGVFVRIGDTKVWFYEVEFVSLYQGQKVYVRFDPDNLSSVRVYDENEKFLTVLDRGAEGGYEGEDNTEAMKQINSNKRKVKHIVKDFIENQEKIMQTPEMRDVVVNIARNNIEQDTTQYEADILEGMFINEQAKAVGEGVEIDFSKMIENAKKQKDKDK